MRSGRQDPGNVISCPRCGRAAPAFARFCNRCGAGMSRPAETAALHPSIPSGTIRSEAGAFTGSQALNSLVALDRNFSSAQEAPAAAGRVVADRYRLVKIIGKGGLGVVYRARDLAMERNVAFKALLPELMNQESLLRRFEEQVLPVSRLIHDRVVPILDVGNTGDVAYLVMPFMPGGSLGTWIRSKRARRRTPQDLVRILGWIDQAAQGLAGAHPFVIHRDIKPENILFDGSGKAALADFDLAKFRRASPLTMTGQAVGTAYYMAPEQITDSGGVDGRADIFSLGVVLYEAVCGELPVGSFRPLSRTVPGAPALLDEMVSRMLAHDPAARFQFASEVSEAAIRAAAVIAGRGAGTGGGKSGAFLSRLADKIIGPER